MTETAGDKEKKFYWDYFLLLFSIGAISICAIFILPRWLDSYPETISAYNREIDSVLTSLNSTTFSSADAVKTELARLKTESARYIIEKEKPVRDIIIQVCAGALALIGIYLTARRTKALEKQNEISRENYQALLDKIENDKDFNEKNFRQQEERNQNEKDNNDKKFILEQFSRASELLQSKEISGRLSGIYMFEKIMNESQQYHWQVIELLTAFVRENRSIDKYIIDEKPDLKSRTRLYGKQSSKVNKEDTVTFFEYKFTENREILKIEKKFRKIPVEKDIQAILTVVGRRNRDFEKEFIKNNEDENNQQKEYINLSVTNLFGADFSKGHFEWFNFTGSILIQSNCQSAHFEKGNCIVAHFENANCRYAHFENANCIVAHFENANCEVAHFENADCEVAHFENANCEVAHFENAVCWNAHFENADCERAHFENAKCEVAHFENANCERAHFENANCMDADFKDTKWLTVEQLLEAKTLFGVKNLAPEIEAELRKQKPELFENPK